jgi:hypothetical protein
MHVSISQWSLFFVCDVVLEYLFVFCAVVFFAVATGWDDLFFPIISQ